MPGRRNRLYYRLRDYGADRILGFTDRGNRRQEPVTPPGDRFHIAGCLRAVPNCITDLPDCDSQAVIKFHEGVLRPKELAHLFAGDDLSMPLHQNDEQAVRQILQLELVAVTCQGGRAGIE